MASNRGNCIVVSAEPGGPWSELIVPVGETWLPGVIVQKDPTVALRQGRHTGKLYSRDADGDRPKGGFWVVVEDAKIGRTTADSYAAGERARVYCPEAGEELNLLYKNVTGTADDVAAGDILTVDTGTGKVQVSSGTPETEVAVALAAIVDPTADTLLWCEWSGH